MANDKLSTEEAGAALTEVAKRRQQVAELYVPMSRGRLALAMACIVGLFALMDVPQWPRGVGATVELLAWPAFIGGVVMDRRRRVVPHRSLFGVRHYVVQGVVMIAAAALALLARQLIIGSGMPLPNTMTGLVTAFLGIAGYVLSNKWLRRIMLNRARKAVR